MRLFFESRAGCKSGSRAIILLVALMTLAGFAGSLPVHAIEMFTYFGDGSRIGLPNLEVPIEAYPGIPLRSDRIRARRRGFSSSSTNRQTSPPGITIRTLPQSSALPSPPMSSEPTEQ